MKKINFRQPKYVVPAIVLPFLLFGYYLLGQFGNASANKQTTTIEDSVHQEGFNADMPGVGKKIENESFKNTFDAYKDAYKTSDKYSPLIGIDPNETNGEEENILSYSSKDIEAINAKRQLDSLNNVLSQQHKDIDEQMSSLKNNRQSFSGNNTSYTKNSNSKNRENIDEQEFLNELKKIGNDDYTRASGKHEVKETDPYEQQMKIFREQMQLVDSMQNESSKREGQSNTINNKGTAKRNFDPKSDSTFKPLPVSANPSFIESTFNTIKSFSKNEAIEAIIDQDEKAFAGTRIRIRLLQDIYVGGKLIPKSTYLYAVVTGFQTSRINLSISQIFYKNKTLPVSLDVFDNDGYLGLYVPGSTFREFTKEIGTQGTNGLSTIQTSDDSDAMQGILNRLFKTSTTAAANLIKKEKAFVKYNYVVYLKENQK